MVRAVRGAIKVKKNTRDDISRASVKLIKEITRRNHIAEDHMVSIVFSVTKDLTSFNPATGLREHGFNDVPLFCAQEAYIVGQEPKIIRVLVTFECSKFFKPIPVYLDGAELLRPDQAYEKNE